MSPHSKRDDDDLRIALRRVAWVDLGDSRRALHPLRSCGLRLAEFLVPVKHPAQLHLLCA